MKMVNYVVVNKNTESTETEDKNVYGICAWSLHCGLLEIRSCIYGISDDVTWLKALADRLNQYDVDPIHLRDIIEDELYKVGA